MIKIWFCLSNFPISVLYLFSPAWNCVLLQKYPPSFSSFALGLFSPPSNSQIFLTECTPIDCSFLQIIILPYRSFLLTGHLFLTSLRHFIHICKIYSPSIQSMPNCYLFCTRNLFHFFWKAFLVVFFFFFLFFYHILMGCYST